MAKYFVAEGVAAGHDVLLLSPEGSLARQIQVRLSMTSSVWASDCITYAATDTQLLVHDMSTAGATLHSLVPSWLATP
jgi:hypothetical protein